MATPSLTCIFICLIIGSGFCQNIGDSCIDGDTRGVCKLATECRSAFRNLTSRKPPKLCSYSLHTSIVCCIQGSSTSNSASEQSGNRNPISSQESPSPQIYPGYKDDPPAWPSDTVNDKPRIAKEVPVTSTSKLQYNNGKRISEIKCSEYSERVTEKVQFIPLLWNPEPIEIESSKCVYDSVSLIVGGDPADVGEFPHMAAIGWTKVSKGYDFKCGGSLISDKFVLTAGHCLRSVEDTTVTNPVPAIVRLGDHNLQEDVYDGASPIDVPIKRTLKHPDYRPPKRYNDIGLLELEHKVEFSSFIRPACLWNKSGFDGRTKAVATGWGVIAYHESRSDELLKVSLSLFETEVCEPLLTSLRNRNWKEGFIPEQICAGNLTGLRDTCQGDSGGPLQIASQNNQCIFYIVGVTSFGPSCGKVNGPGVYTRVSSYLDWIEDIVWNNL